MAKYLAIMLKLKGELLCSNVCWHMCQDYSAPMQGCLIWFQRTLKPSNKVAVVVTCPYMGPGIVVHQQEKDKRG